MRKLSIILLFLTLAVLPFACTQKANDTDHNQVAQNKTSDFDDAAITTKVKVKLASDDLVKARNIDVDTTNGLVALRGSVSSDQEASRAVQLAESVDGVRTVHSFLKADLAENTNNGNPDTVSNLENSAKNGFDKVETATKDAAITAEVKMKLASDKMVDASHIDVDTNNGTVTLKGTVHTRAEESRAVQVARNIDDVRSVQSDLTIE